MVLDKVMFKYLNKFSKNLCEEFKIDAPNSRSNLYIYLQKLKKGIENNEANANFIGLNLYNFVSAAEVRDRHVTARVFEDIFGELTGSKATDVENRPNPPTTRDIEQYDTLCEGKGWKVSTDLSSNKREKADHAIGTYTLSIKTLKGKLYDETGKVIDRDFNNEVNIGSLSHRALFVGLVDEALSDRKGGLGSPKQIIPLITKIKSDGNLEEFRRRIKDYITYVYDDDILIVLKSGYRMKLILIPKETFIKAIVTSLDNKHGIKTFTSIWYRWENNNLRIKWCPLMELIEEMEYEYLDIELDFQKIFENKVFMNKVNNLLNIIDKKIEEIID